MTKISHNLIGAMVIGSITLIYLYEAVQLPFGSLVTPGSGFVPVIVAVIILAMCIFKAGAELLFPSGNDDKKVDLWSDDEPSKNVDQKRPLKIMIAVILYPIVLGYLGFILATSILLFVTLRFMEYRSWWVSLLVAIVITIVTKFVFGNIFDVMFPMGIFS